MSRSFNARGGDERFAVLRTAVLDGTGPDGSVRSAFEWQAHMRELLNNSGKTTVSANIDLKVLPTLPPIDADFHASRRHTYFTELLRNGVALAEAKELARTPTST